MNRRTLFKGGMALALGYAAAGIPGVRAGDVGLGTLAARTGRFFGTALGSDDLTRDPLYRHILDWECSAWTPEWEMKWEPLYSDPDNAPNFAPADTIVATGRAEGKLLRGHTIIWHEALPPVIETLSTAADWDAFVAPHIRMVAGHFRDALSHIDVVNEPIEPYDNGVDLMRRSIFYDMLGPDYVAEAFRLAHDAAPEMKLYLNEYGLEPDTDHAEQRRRGVLALLTRLVRDSVPVHGLGLQGHLVADRPFSAAKFDRFLEEVEALGLEMTISELDVREGDSAGSLSLDARRWRAADMVDKVMSVALDSPALAGIITWELEDADSWIRVHQKIMDNQGLPYSDDLKPTPMRKTLARLFANTRVHHG